MVVQSSLLLSQPLVPAIVHVAQARVTVNLMTSASLEQPVDQKIVLLLKPVLNVMRFFQMLIVVSIWDLPILAKTNGRQRNVKNKRRRGNAARKRLLRSAKKPAESVKQDFCLES